MWCVKVNISHVKNEDLLRFDLIRTNKVISLFHFFTNSIFCVYDNDVMSDTGSSLFVVNALITQNIGIFSYPYRHIDLHKLIFLVKVS